MMFRAVPGLALGANLSLRIGDGPELRLSPLSGFALAHELLNRAAEVTVKEAAAKEREQQRLRGKRRAA